MNTESNKNTDNEKFRERVGNNIKYFLDQKKETQRWLAEKTNATNAQVNKWIKGQYMPSPANMQKIANALDVSISRLYHYGPYGIKEQTKEKSYEKTSNNGSDLKSMEIKVIHMRIDKIATEVMETENEYVRETKRRIQSLANMG